MVRRASRPGAKLPPVQVISAGASPSSSAAATTASSAARARGHVGADGHAEPALELEPVRHLARPRAARDAADEQRVRQRQLAHQRVLDARR